ncbi:hypothetical protein BJF79_18490 [Actinomadura sp. CNU-125]|uniref:PEP/pyruvate-binding domain-containing protein n=1 Tax=Actinomadura sp. CNU-125 TaxID=1904961 RepID=UPI000963DF4E|nr:PEP/pyruvate-binding domain-containing protein [Actinomadura sp. CNU-125]OLT16051.1 hypothetical protein BJF79_18490 [Actinomadura sp. CNU-125]
MTWIRPLAPGVDEPATVLGGKAHGLITLRRLGLPVPPGFVIGTAACRAFLRDGRLPDGLDAELAAAVADLEAATGRRLGGPDRPLVLAVRSGGAVSMPGMMDTILNLGLTTDATAGLAAETGDPRFAHDSRDRLHRTFTATATTPGSPAATTDDGTDERGAPRERPSGSAGAGTCLPPSSLDAATGLGTRPDDATRGPEAPDDGTDEGRAPRERASGSAGAGSAVPDDAWGQLVLAVRGVFASWNTPRARTYRMIRGIPDESGTAVIVQAMVFGNRDGRSGTGARSAAIRGPASPVRSGRCCSAGRATTSCRDGRVRCGWTRWPSGSPRCGRRSSTP